MLEPIYSIFNLIAWSICCLWCLIWWMFIIITVITFIGFINVQFFTKNHQPFNQMLQDEYKSRFQINKHTTHNNKPESDNEDTLSNTSSHSRSMRKKQWSRSNRKPKKNKLTADIIKPWTLSERIKSRRYRQESPSYHSNHSSTSSTRSLHSISTVSVSRHAHQKYINSPSHSNKKYISIDNSDSENDKFGSLRNESNQTKKKISEFNVNEMHCFDDLYDFMTQFVVNKIDMTESIKIQIQNCIENGSLKLMTFEKALLNEKLTEISTK